MKVISLVSWKGGTGKTTLACNLSDRAVNSGLRTLLCDFDGQEAALQHCLRRENYPDSVPRIEAVKASLTVEGISGLEAEIKRDEYDLIICDTPGADDVDWDRCAGLADLLLAPVSPSPYEVLVTRRFLDHSQERGWRLAVVLNNLLNARKRNDELRGVFHLLGVPVAPVNLIRRVEYWNSGLQGLGVCESAPRSAACREMTRLWEWVAGELGLELPKEEIGVNGQEAMI